MRELPRQSVVEASQGNLVHVQNCGQKAQSEQECGHFEEGEDFCWKNFETMETEGLFRVAFPIVQCFVVQKDPNYIGRPADFADV